MPMMPHILCEVLAVMVQFCRLCHVFNLQDLQAELSIKFKLPCFALKRQTTLFVVRTCNKLHTERNCLRTTCTKSFEPCASALRQWTVLALWSAETKTQQVRQTRDFWWCRGHQNSEQNLILNETHRKLMEINLQKTDLQHLRRHLDLASGCQFDSGMLWVRH